MTLAQLKKLKPEIRAYVREVVLEELGDPDAGLELHESFKRVLRARAKTPKGKYIPFEEVKKKYSLK